MAAIPLCVRARAKLNLFLNVVGRREDGYHEIDSLFAFCELSDLVTIVPAEMLFFDPPEGQFAADVESDASNLVMRAAELLRREAGIASGARITLVKHIPVAAGLGGGSADAAAALAGLNRFWTLHWPLAKLEAMSAQLGADVPACVRLAPVYARGVGERLTDAPPLPRCGILLANPRIPTPTPAVFKAYCELNPVVRPRDLPPLPDRFDDLGSLVAAIAPRGNDLLSAALRVTPAIGEALDALQALPRVAHAGLSGSGATCFALFETVNAARAAEARLALAQPDWWAWSGGWAA